MKISELTAKNLFATVNDGGNGDTEITKPFACDLLSFAMSKASSGCAWFTVMGNVNIKGSNWKIYKFRFKIFLKIYIFVKKCKFFLFLIKKKLKKK